MNIVTVPSSLVDEADAAGTQTGVCTARGDGGARGAAPWGASGTAWHTRPPFTLLASNPVSTNLPQGYPGKNAKQRNHRNIDFGVD